MSISADGINLVWCIEKEVEDSITGASCTEISFPSSEVLLELTFTSMEVNNTYFLTIMRTDHWIEYFTIYGSISIFTSADSISLLKEFEIDLKCHSKLFVRLTELGENPNILDNMLLNKKINLLIQLCNSPEKKTSVTRHFVSPLSKQRCNFEWVLDTQNEKVHDEYEDTPCHAFFTNIPRHFLFDEMEYVGVRILLIFESFLEIKNKYIFKICTLPGVCGKIKIEVKSENRGTFDLINTEFFSGSEDRFRLNEEKIEELIANKQIYYPRRFLILNVCSEVISYLKSKSVEIEEIDYLSGVKNIAALIEKSNKFCQHAFENPPETLSTSLYSLYREGQLCDVTLCVGEEKFPCHKLVLSARSPVFRTMFQNNELGKEGNLVPIPDLKSDSLRIFLSTLYSNSLSDVKSGDVWNVYEAAVKYDVPVIRKLCSNFLLSTLSLVNVCQNLEFSYDHKDEYLMKEIKNFIFKHAQEIIKLSVWDDLISRKPLLAANVMKEIFST